MFKSLKLTPLSGDGNIMNSLKKGVRISGFETNPAFRGRKHSNPNSFLLIGADDV